MGGTPCAGPCAAERTGSDKPLASAGRTSRAPMTWTNRLLFTRVRSTATVWASSLPCSCSEPALESGAAAAAPLPSCCACSCPGRRPASSVSESSTACAGAEGLGALRRGEAAAAQDPRMSAGRTPNSAAARPGSHLGQIFAEVVTRALLLLYSRPQQLLEPALHAHACGSSAWLLVGVAHATSEGRRRCPSPQGWRRKATSRQAAQQQQSPMRPEISGATCAWRHDHPTALNLVSLLKTGRLHSARSGASRGALGWYHMGTAQFLYTIIFELSLGASLFQPPVGATSFDIFPHGISHAEGAM